MERTAFEDRVAGRRVVSSSDGGRMRLRDNTRGPQTKQGRRRYTGAWREPKVLIVYTYCISRRNFFGSKQLRGL